MGIKQKSDTEIKNLKLEETGVGLRKTVTPKTTPPPEVGKPISTCPRLDALKAILEDIDAPPQI